MLGETMEGREGFVLSEAFDSTLIDNKGKKYIDFTAGWNVMNVGWSRKEIIDAISAQLKKYPYAPMWCTTETTVNFAKAFQKILPSKLNTFFKTTGGTESNELALKIARAYTGKKKIFSFYGEYHGQTFGSISLGNSAKTTNPFEPLVPGFIRVQPPYHYRSAYGENLGEEEFSEKCLASIQKNIEAEGDVAAFLCEVVLTCPGVIVPLKNFFRGLSKICKDNGMLLIIDEVGTGFGRTGKMFAFEHFGFVPDIVMFAKAISGGYGAMGAVATSRKIADVMLGKGGTSTFGWHTLSVTAANESLKIIHNEKLAVKAQKMGEYIMERLKRELSDVDIVGDIRGLGLEIGIELVKDRKSRKPNKDAADKVTRNCLRDGLHIVWAGRTTTIMIMPPLIISKEEVDKGLEILIYNIRKL